MCRGSGVRPGRRAAFAVRGTVMAALTEAELHGRIALFPEVPGEKVDMTPHEVERLDPVGRDRNEQVSVLQRKRDPYAAEFFG